MLLETINEINTEIPLNTPSHALNVTATPKNTPIGGMSKYIFG